MNLNIVALNKGPKGFINKVEEGNLTLYLLGYINNADKTDRIVYAPTYIAYNVNISPIEYIRRYLGLLPVNVPQHHSSYRTKVLKRMGRLQHTKNIENSHLIQEFLTAYDSFKKNNPDFSENRESYYRRFPINKRKGKLGKNGRMYYKKRWITEPIEDLKNLQRQVKHILEDVMQIKYHDAAHAYTKNRTNITNAKVHKYSKHIINIDLKDFFPSITPLFLKTLLCSLKEFAILRVEPSVISRLPEEVQNYSQLMLKLLVAIIDIAQYNNGLPQGSPLSPTLVNIVMLEIDQQMEKIAKSREHSQNIMMYSRYSDDLTFSSFSPIKLDALVDNVRAILNTYSPLTINEEKVKYIKSTNRCYVTGVKLNKENTVTYGHEKKAEIKKQLFALLMARKNGQFVSTEAQKVLGKIAYMQSIEPVQTREMLKKYAQHFGIRPNRIFKHLTAIN